VTRGASSPKEYTPWATRVVAWLIDWLPVVILSSIGALLLFLLRDVEIVCTDDYCPSIDNGPSGLAWTIYGVLELVSLAYVIWNLGHRQGTTGSSIGKGILKFEVVSERTGQPIGFGRSLVREIAYAVAYVVCFLPWVVVVLFPLWDSKRQTLVDKLVKTVCRPR